MLTNVFEHVDDITSAWESWYKMLSEQGDNISSRDGEVIGEILNAVTVLRNPINNILESDIRKLSMKYAVGELLWYISANPKLSEIQKYTTGWNKLSDDGINVNSNYGYCIKEKYGFDQFDYIINELKSNPNSRRAVVHIKEPNNKDSKDVNCTVCLQFFIRDNKLYMTTYMRSNDIWLGFPYDVFQFTNLQILLSMILGLELGTYTHVVGSLHLYKRNFKEI